MQTQLFDWHKENGDIIDFAGFKMPVMYSTIKEEHLAVRNSVGLFDVSHMGRLWLQGDDVLKFLNYLVPRDLTKTAVGRASYTFILNENGGFKDDVVFEHLEEEKWLLVWNAGNLRKIRNWIKFILRSIQYFSPINVNLEDISSTSAMFALQGPTAENVLKTIISANTELPTPWSIIKTQINDIDVIISGTGYSGEAGYEIIVENTTNDDPEKALTVWSNLLKNGENYDIKPCGLGARDTLRLEAGYHLYGNDILENINPIEADLFFPPFIHMQKEDFIGKQGIVDFQKQEQKRIRIGLIAKKKGPSPRPGQKLLKQGKIIGKISSGGFSPLLDIGIGMGYIDPMYNKENEIIQFQVRDRAYDAVISKYPLYNPEIFGKTRKK
ncbi:MAG: glycine cleavage system aminomethyltransferase GcvT [Candidatus Hodarchaeales archaeon]|jgi:aminomethyltransferase